MARISKGILGGFSGTVGTVVGGTWKGISYMRSQAVRKNTTSTAKQKAQQQRFSVAARFIQLMPNLLMVTFKNYAVKMTGVNSALGYTLRNAVTGTYPNAAIDYTKVLMSRGDIPNATSPAAAAAGSGKLHFSWTDNSGIGKAMATDSSILVAFCPATNQCIYNTSGAARSTGTATLDVAVLTGKQVHTYIGFISQDGQDIASSIYTGLITVS
jgi:hypothetical protein